MYSNVVVLAGGISSEREIALRSGANCFEALCRLGYQSQLIDFKGRESVLQLIEMSPDAVFLMTHGEGGEDGAIQGLLDWLKLPYTGSGRKASALCMDKYASKWVLQKGGCPVAPATMWSPQLGLKQLKEEWSCEALFAKPRYGGSSVDTHLVREAELMKRLSPNHLIEPYLPGKEVTVGFIEETSGWKCLPMLELRPKKEFYDFEAKYTEGMTEFILPAEISSEEESLLQSLGERALTLTGVQGFGRVDFLLHEKGCVVMEINTLPGMTNTSDLPAQAKTAGIAYDQLVEKILHSMALKE